MTWCLETGVLAGDDAGAGGLGASGTGARICLRGRYAAGHRDAVPVPRRCGNLTGSIGIFYSSVLRRSTVSTVCSYVTVVALTAGTMAVNLFAYRMALRAANSYASNLNASEMASSGILRYLFLFNPAVSFYNVINGQAGSGDMRNGSSRCSAYFQTMRSQHTGRRAA